MYPSLLAACSKPPALWAAACSLFGPATCTAGSRSSPTGTLPARHRQALAFLQHLRRHQRVCRRRGYQVVQAQGKRYYVHRAVMAILLGRPLTRQEHVHHRNGDVTNNTPANLQVLSIQAHTVVTCAKHPLVGCCMGCGRPFLRRKRARNRGFCCCRKCWRAVARRWHGWHNIPFRPAWSRPLRP